MCQWIEHFIPSHHPPLLVTGLGVGVHLTLLRSLSLGLEDPLPSQLANLPMTSARLVAAVPIVDLSSNRLAAGVSAGVRKGLWLAPVDCVDMAMLAVALPVAAVVDDIVPSE